MDRAAHQKPHHDGVGREFIYAVSNPAFPGLLKIGMTRVSPEDRARALSGCLPTQCQLEHAIRTCDARTAEGHAHYLLAPHHVRGEWFRVTLDEAKEAMRLATSDLSHLHVATAAKSRLAA